jgi:mannose-6-phosphate isomerase-like protein (cupin superfamily)
MTFVDTSEMVKGAPLTGWEGRFFHSDNMTFAHWDIAAGAAPLHEHQHPQEEVWNIVEGELLLSIDGDERTVTAGQAAIIPPHTRHSVRVVGACRALVTDFPVRPEVPGS